MIAEQMKKEPVEDRESEAEEYELPSEVEIEEEERKISVSSAGSSSDEEEGGDDMCVTSHVSDTPQVLRFELESCL